MRANRLTFISIFQAILFLIICCLGFYINNSGVRGGASSIDDAHIYVVKLNRNVPRYLTENQAVQFNSALCITAICILIFALIIIWQILRTKQ